MYFDVTELLLVLLGTAMLGGLVVYGVDWLVKWKKAQNGVTQEFVEAVVEIAEKLYVGKGRGKEKLAYVIGVIESECNRLGITFDEKKVTEIINKYVEEAFNSAKK